MRADVLELMAEEIAGHPAGPLDSFTTWTGGRRHIDGFRVVASGKAATDKWQQWKDAYPERQAAAKKRYDSDLDVRREAIARLKAWKLANPEKDEAARKRYRSSNKGLAVARIRNARFRKRRKERLAQAEASR